MYRKVTATKKQNGDIIEMSGRWGTVLKEDAIEHINNFTYKYFVYANREEMDVRVVYSPLGWILRTTPDNKPHNLHNLPDI